MISTRCGYNCINLSLPTTYNSYRLQTVLDRDLTKIKRVVDSNLMLLSDTIAWNIQNGYRLFRMTSNLIPFLAHGAMRDILVNTDLMTRDCVINEINHIRNLVETHKLRLTIHPSQMNVLSSSDPTILRRTIDEVELQTKLMKMLGGDTLLLHIGGTYGDKAKAKKTFISNVKNYLSPEALSIFAIENDDKSYTSEDVIEVTTELNIPWVYDIHHENLNKSSTNIIDLLRLKEPTKYHLCDGMNGELVIPHDAYVKPSSYLALCNQITNAGYTEADIMFEAKCKNLSVTNILKPIGNGYWELK